MLDARRYRSAAGAPAGAAGAPSTAFASARRRCRRSCAARILAPAEGSEDPQVLGEAIGRLLAMPPTISLRHIGFARVTVAERLEHLRGLLARGASASTRRCAAPIG